MNKRNAIDILNKQIVKMDEDSFHSSNWTIQTKTYLKDFFGENSDQHVFFDSEHWKFGCTLGDGKDELINRQLKEQAVPFLSDCMDTIDDIGLFKKPIEGNFISRMPEKYAVAFVLGIISLSFYIGTIVCKIP